MRRSRPQKPAPPPAPGRSSDGLLVTLTPLLVAAVTFLAFVPVLRNGFVTWDDDRNFLTNPHYRGLGAEQLHWMWTTFHLGHYVPLTWMSLGLDYVLWGMNPAGYHLTNVLLHSANAVLVYFLALQILRTTGRQHDTKTEPTRSRHPVILSTCLP